MMSSRAYALSSYNTKMVLGELVLAMARLIRGEASLIQLDSEQ